MKAGDELKLTKKGLARVYEPVTSLKFISRGRDSHLTSVMRNGWHVMMIQNTYIELAGNMKDQDKMHIFVVLSNLMPKKFKSLVRCSVDLDDYKPSFFNEMVKGQSFDIHYRYSHIEKASHWIAISKNKEVYKIIKFNKL